MKKIYVSTLAMFLFFVKTINSQEADPKTTNPISCSYRLEIANKYLKKYEHLDDLTISKIKQSIINCFDNSKESYFAKGILKLVNSKNDIQKREAFQDVFYSAQLGYQESYSTLGHLYKEGLGVNQNYKKAFYWFKKGVNIKDDESIYAVGYLYLKGLGVNQDYSKAISYFKSSKHVMAKHWLSVCEYKGYGMTDNDIKALNRLSNNKNVINSTVLLDKLTRERFISKQDINKNSVKKFFEENNIAFKENNNLNSNRLSNLDSNAKLIEYDWSNGHITRFADLKFNFAHKENDRLNYSFELNNSKQTGVAFIKENKIVFNDFKFNQIRLYPDSRDKQFFEYAINSIVFDEVFIDNQKYLVGKLNGVISELKEPIPTILIAFKNNSFTKLANKESVNNSLLSVFPMPFNESIEISFVNNTSSTTKINILNQEGTRNWQVVNNHFIKGKHKINYNTKHLSSGVYVLQIIQDDNQTSKIIIKK